MKIKDRPEYKSKPKPATLPPTATVREAVILMSEKGYGSVIITDENNKVTGIVTERDLMKRLLYKKMDQETTKLSEIMSTDLRLAREDDDMLDWLRIMSNERFRHLPVVDDDGCPVNLMSQGDFVSYTWPELIDRLKETAKASFAQSYQIVFIVMALLIYALLVQFMG